MGQVCVILRAYKVMFWGSVLRVQSVNIKEVRNVLVDCEVLIR